MVCEYHGMIWSATSMHWHLEHGGPINSGSVAIMEVHARRYPSREHVRTGPLNRRFSAILTLTFRIGVRDSKKIDVRQHLLLRLACRLRAAFVF